MVHTTIKPNRLSPKAPIKTLIPTNRLTTIFIQVAKNQKQLSDDIEIVKKKLENFENKFKQYDELTEDIATHIRKHHRIFKKINKIFK